MASIAITSVFVFSYYFLFRWLCNVRASVAPNLLWVLEWSNVMPIWLLATIEQCVWPLIFDLTKLSFIHQMDRIRFFVLVVDSLHFRFDFQHEHSWLFVLLSRFTIHYAATEVCWCQPKQHRKTLPQLQIQRTAAILKAKKKRTNSVWAKYINLTNEGDKMESDGRQRSRRWDSSFKTFHR